eukprot:scaffold292332_cov40-Tisochrysis_lutea.AAC.1
MRRSWALLSACATHPPARRTATAGRTSVGACQPRARNEAATASSAMNSRAMAPRTTRRDREIKVGIGRYS